MATPPVPIGLSRRALRLLLRSNAWVAVGVGSLGWWVARSAGVTLHGATLVVLLGGTLLIYNLDHLRDDRSRRRDDSLARPRLALGVRRVVLALGLICLGAGFVAGGTPLLIASIPGGLIGLLYGARLGSDRRLKDLPGAKAWLVAAAVSQVCLLLPLVEAGIRPSLAHVPLGFFLMVLCALNAHCFDLRDLDVDRRAGASTWATDLGGEQAHRRLVVVSLLATLGAVALWWAGLLPASAPGTLSIATASLPLVPPGAPRERFGVVVDGWLVLPALLSLL
ncbi:MAG: UbiA family prenyltransferase [Deltaproteobacteria bacterium]|nr:UbiA family prenyltransferase [Deltaproteobacteria bacterium]